MSLNIDRIDRRAALGAFVGGAFALNKMGLAVPARAQSVDPREAIVDRFAVKGPALDKENWKIINWGDGITEARLDDPGENSVLRTSGALIEGFFTIPQVDVRAPLWSRDRRAVTYVVDGSKMTAVPAQGASVYYGGAMDNPAYMTARRQSHFEEFLAREREEQQGVAIQTWGFASECPPLAGVPLRVTPEQAAEAYGVDAHSRNPANWTVTEYHIVDQGPVVGLHISEAPGGAHTRIRAVYGLTIDGYEDVPNVGPVVMTIDGTAIPELLTPVDGFRERRLERFVDLRAGTVYNTQDFGFATPRDLAVARIARAVRINETFGQPMALQIQAGFFQEGDFNAVACAVDP